MLIDIILEVNNELNKQMPVVMIEGFECTRCDHQWVPRNKSSHPVVCPRCKSPYWDKAKKTTKTEGDKP